MQRSLRDSESAHKGKSEGKFAPPFIPSPGEALVDLIQQHRRVGRAVWRVYSLVVPRLEFVAVRDPETDEPILYRPLAASRDARPYFRRRVLLYLETSQPAALETLRKDDLVELRRLTAAALRDIWGYSGSDVATKLGYMDDGTARRDVRAGRNLWPHLGAWPWCEWESGKPPDDWWRSGPDRTDCVAPDVGDGRTGSGRRVEGKGSATRGPSTMVPARCSGAQGMHEGLNAARRPFTVIARDAPLWLPGPSQQQRSPRAARWRPTHDVIGCGRSSSSRGPSPNTTQSTPLSPRR
jgi:hypothetical protein